MTELLILTPDADEYAPLIQREAPADLSIHTAADLKAAGPDLARAEILLGAPSLVAQALARAPSLRWVQSTFAGVDPLMGPRLRRDYLLTGVKGVFGPLMSEYVFGWLIAIERELFVLHEQQRAHQWIPRPYRGLAGLTLGIAGLGSIGQHIAATARAFGMRAFGFRRTPGEVAGIERVFSGDALGDFLAASDHVVLTLPATPQTRHLIDARALAAMKPRAVLINVGRGSVVDTDALAEALRRKAIGGAVLDVFEEEPLPAASPLWSLPGCHVTPHISAYSFPEEIAKIFLDNLRRWRAGEPLANVVDFERGY